MRVTNTVNHEIDRLSQLRSRPVLASTSWLIDTRADEITRWVARGAELTDRLLERSWLQVAELVSGLRALSPQRTLDRGYAIAQLPDGSVLTAATDAPAGTALLLTLADGKLDTTVDGAHPTSDAGDGDAR
jgi:exodeoxyribonuclease VII large subunit